jgi:hypothetical protein
MIMAKLLVVYDNHAISAIFNIGCAYMQTLIAEILNCVKFVVIGEVVLYSLKIVYVSMQEQHFVILPRWHVIR